MDGLLGVAGMIVIASGSFPKFPTFSTSKTLAFNKCRHEISLFLEMGMPKPMEFNTHIMMVEFWMNWGTPILGNLRLGIPLTRIGCDMNFDVQKLHRHKSAQDFRLS